MMEHEKKAAAAAAEAIERNFIRTEPPTPHVNRLGDTAGQACREAHWHEMVLEAKVERLREMLNIVAGQTDNAGRIASEAHAVALTHEHHAYKGLMQPIRTEHGYGTPGWSDIAKLLRARLA